MVKNPELNHQGFLYHHDGNHNEIGNPHPQYVSSVYSHTIGNGVSTNLNNWIKVLTLAIAKKTTDEWGYVRISLINAETGSQNSLVFETFLKVRYSSGAGTSISELQVKDINGSNVTAVISADDTNSYTVDLYVKNTLSFGIFRVRELARNLTNNITLTYYDESTNWITSLPSGPQVTASYVSPYFNTITATNGTFTNTPTAGGNTLFHAGNHNSSNDPHTQYVRKTPFVTSNTGGTAGQWALIGTATLTAQFQESVALINFIGGASGATTNTQRGLLFFRLKQQQALASSPYIEMVLIDQNNFSTTDVAAIITTNTASQTVVQLYVKINATNEQLWFNPIHDTQNYVGSTAIVWSDRATLIASSGSLPAGVQTNALYQQQVLSGITANRPTVGLYVGMPFFDTTLGKQINVKQVSPAIWVDGSGVTV